MSKFRVNRCLLLFTVVSLFAGFKAQDWCEKDGEYKKNDTLCLDHGGINVTSLFCKFDLNEEEEIGFVVFNVSLPDCDPYDVVAEFFDEGYISYSNTTSAIVVSGRIDIDVLKDDGTAFEYLGGSVRCSSQSKSEALCFTIKLEGINDNLPEITLEPNPINITELKIQYDKNSAIATVTISDVDLGKSHRPTEYGIADQDVPFALAPSSRPENASLENPGCQTDYSGFVNETKFDLIVTRPKEIDFETNNTYIFTIYAWEGCNNDSDHNRNDTAIVTVDVHDGDDLPPEFKDYFYTASVREGEVNKSLPVSPEIIAEDGDTMGEEIVYNLKRDDQGLNCVSKLHIDSNSAVITVTESIIYAEQKECKIQVQASQLNNPQQSSKAPLIITILPKNEECPSFSEDSFTGFYFKGDDYVLNEEMRTLEITLTDSDVIFEGNITVSSESLYNVTDEQTEGQSTTFRLAPKEEPITENTTIEIFVSDDYLGCVNNASVLVQLGVSDFLFDDQTVSVKEGDTEVYFDSPSMRNGFCATYEVTEGNFTINNGSTEPKIVADTPFDYETNELHQVLITAFKGEPSDGKCKPTDATETAVITIKVVDLNDETPSFNVMETNGVLFDAVFFDVMGHEKIFSLADRAIDADSSARLIFNLSSSDPSPLLHRTDGTVLTDSTFDFLRNVNKGYDYKATVTDIETDVNNASSLCPLKFGIMGWNEIFIFQWDAADQTSLRFKRSDLQFMAYTTEETVARCEEMGKIGWSLDENTYIKIDRIIQNENTYYIWLYGVNPSVPKYLTKGDFEETDVPGLLNTKCQFDDVSWSTKTSFVSYPIRDSIFVFIAVILFIGIIIMIIFLFYSWNKFLQEKERFQEFRKVEEPVEKKREKTPVPESEPEPEPELLQLNPIPVPVVLVHAEPEPAQRLPIPVQEYEWQEAIIEMQSVASFSMLNLGPEANPGGRDDSSSETTISTDGDTEPLIPYATFTHMNMKPPEAHRNEIPNETKSEEVNVKSKSSSKEEMSPVHMEVMLNRSESTTDPKNRQLEHPDEENERSIRNDEGNDQVGSVTNEGIKCKDNANDVVTEEEQDSGNVNEAFESFLSSSPVLSPKALTPPSPFTSPTHPQSIPPPASLQPTQLEADTMQDNDDNY